MDTVIGEIVGVGANVVEVKERDGRGVVHKINKSDFNVVPRVGRPVEIALIEQPGENVNATFLRSISYYD